MSTFKVPNLNRWLVIVSGPKLVEELRKAPQDQLSFTEAVNEVSCKSRSVIIRNS